MGDKRSKSTAGSKPTDRQRAARDDGPAELRAQIAVLAEQVRRLNVTDAPRPPSPAASTVTAPAAGATLAAAEVIATAERAAAEVRESARREAERIRAQRRDVRDATATELLSVLRRQRLALAALAAEVARLEHTAQALHEQIDALDAELTAAHRILAALTPHPAADL